MNCFVSATGTAFLFSVLLATVAKFLFRTDGLSVERLAGSGGSRLLRALLEHKSDFSALSKLS